MAESAEFILRLNDQVSGAAKSAADSLRRIDDKATSAARKMALVQLAAEKMNQQLGQSAASGAARALDAQAKAADKAAAATRKLGLMQIQAQKLNAAHDARKSGGFLSSFTGKLPFRSISDYASGAFFGSLAASAATGIMGAFVSGASSAVSLISSGIKMAFSEGGKAENLRLSYKLLLGDKGGKEALANISGFAGKTKYDDDAIAEMMRPLFNAGLKGRGATSAFAASGDLEAAGLGKAQDFIEQFTKIQLKGGVTEKLLVGMGVNIRDFKTALATETGNKDKEAAFKQATEGKSDPQAIMNAIFRGIEKRQGGQLGTGTEAASKTMSARLQKLSDLPSQYLKKMSESPAWAVLSAKLGDTLNGLDPDGERGKKIIDSLFRVFDKLATAASEMLTPENIDKFAATVGRVVDWLANLPSILQSIYVISRDLALIWAGVGLLKGVQGFSVALNAAAGASIALVAPIAATAAALASIAFAYTQITDTAKELGGWDAIKDDIANFNPNAMMEDKYSEAAFDAKYSGAGYKLKTSGPGVGPSITHNGDVNLIVAPGQDAKATGESFAKSTAEWQQQLLEKAAATGGG